MLEEDLGAGLLENMSRKTDEGVQTDGIDNTIEGLL